MSIEVKDCKKCVHVKSEANPDYFGGCEFCFRRNDLSDFYTGLTLFSTIKAKVKCPMNNKGICEKGIVPMCKFAKDCMVTPLVHSLFLREKREGLD